MRLYVFLTSYCVITDVVSIFLNNNIVSYSRISLCIQKVILH